MVGDCGTLLTYEIANVMNAVDPRNDLIALRADSIVDKKDTACCSRPYSQRFVIVRGGKSVCWGVMKEKDQQRRAGSVL